MAQKKVEVPGLGILILQKRRGTKNLRLSIAANGQLKVSLPTWTPYVVGIQFARSKRDWIERHQPIRAPSQLAPGQLIGKSHRLVFQSLDSTGLKVTSRVGQTEVIVRTNLPLNDSKVQEKARQASEKALRLQAERLLSVRTEELAKRFGYSYKGLRIKKLTSRWGSCSSAGTITLSLYLMQLPWDLIDYVVVHELAHTRHLNHSPSFWADVQKALPNAKEYRRQIKKFSPSINPASNPGSSVS